MYQYDDIDKTLNSERIDQYRGQVARRMEGKLPEDEFRHLRLRNGLYLQLHAYMLRVAIPYGLLSAVQLRKRAFIARKYDKGYGHFTTRQNIQYNWPKLVDTPDILAHLTEVEMNAIQTSGNCNRNVTSDPYAGVAADEVEDVRPYCELVRQFITLHPEFSFLPRKFKIAISGAAEDRAAIGVHDIGLRLHLNEAGQAGFRILVGGGLGRTPFVAKVVREFLPKEDLLAYVHAILRVYNLEGRRDDLYKSRIKILVHDLGVDKFRQLVEEEFELAKSEEDFADRAELERLSNFFPRPAYETLPEKAPELEEAKADPDLALWVKRNVAAHKQAGYAIVNISLKPIGRPPGDASADQMDAIADLAENYSLGTLRVTHRQNLVLGDVRKKDLAELWKKLADLELASPNIERLGDIISCPGLDYCNLATARSIPVAERLSEHFDETNGAGDLGDLRLNISGCINACGHHHVGHIGLLGVEKLGEEFYQITLGGSSASDASIGEIVGPAVPTGKVVDAVENLLQTYKQERKDDERFLDTYRRIGAQPFKERLYADH